VQNQRAFLSRPDADLAYHVSGQGKCIIFCHALATRQQLWERQRAALSPRFSIVSFDLRGHGLAPQIDRGLAIRRDSEAWHPLARFGGAGSGPAARVCN